MKTTINPRKEYPLQNMVLMLGDVEETLPDVTEEEMQKIARMMGDSLLYAWGETLSDVLTVIKGDRRTEDS